MTAAIGTLIFGFALWLVIVLAIETVRDSGDRIMAALRGEAGIGQASLRFSPARAEPRQQPTHWRAAA